MATKEELVRNMVKDRRVSKEEFIKWLAEKGLILKHTKSWEDIIEEVTSKRGISKADLETFLTEKTSSTNAATSSAQLPPRDTMLRECKECKSLNKRTIKTIAENYQSACKGGSVYDLLESLNIRTMEDIYRAFILKEYDSTGTYLELRGLGYYLAKEFPKFEKEARESLSRIKWREDLTSGPGGQKNFDWVAYYDDDTIDVMECKDRNKPVDDKDLSGYLELIRKVDELKGSGFYDVLHFYFISTSGFTDRALASARVMGGDMGRWTWDKKLLRRKNYIDIHLIAEIDGELEQVYPKE